MDAAVISMVNTHQVENDKIAGPINIKDEAEDMRWKMPILYLNCYEEVLTNIASLNVMNVTLEINDTNQ